MFLDTGTRENIFLRKIKNHSDIDNLQYNILVMIYRLNNSLTFMFKLLQKVLRFFKIHHFVDVNKSLKTVLSPDSPHSILCSVKYISY